MGMRLTRDQILKSEDITTEVVDVPEWGGEVMVRGMSGEQRDAWEASMQERRGKRYVPNLANIRAKLVTWTVIDENGDPLFNQGDVEELGRKSAAALSRVYEVAARLSGVTDEDVEELVENFGKTTGDGSSSRSRKIAAVPSPGSSPKLTPTS